MHRGFSSLEVLLTVGILTFLVGIAMPAYRNYQIRNDLLIATDQVSQALNRAQLRSQAGQQGAAWGFSVSQAVMFMGTAFNGRNQTFDEHYIIPGTIGTSGLDEVSFAPITGMPSTTGAIILTSLRGEQRQVTIDIDRQGIAVNANDRLTLCHCRANPPHTMNLPESAWPAHRRHGDYLGMCRIPETLCK